MVSNLAWEKKIDRENRKINLKIMEVLKSFNRQYENTELDTLGFQKVLESTEFSDDIFERIFKSYTVANDSLEEYKVYISCKAIERVNRYYRKHERSLVSDEQIYKRYFSELVDALIDFREDLLSIKESAQVSVIADKIDSSTNKVLQSFENYMQDSKEDNVFAEEKITAIQNAIDLYKLDEALTLVNKSLEFQTSLSKNQREVIYYQRARIYILTSNYKELEEVKKSIKSLNSDSKYIFEIDYFIACHRKNLDLMEASIKSLETKGYSSQRIILKRIYFDISNLNYENVIKNLLENNEMKSEFKDFHEAYSFIGAVFISQREYSRAETFFERAAELSNSIIYKYNLKLAEAFKLIEKYNETMSFEETDKERCVDLVKQLEELEYILEYFTRENQVNRWLIFLNLALLIDVGMALEKIKDIPTQLDDENILKSLEVDILFKAGKNIEAKNLLLKIWKESLPNVLNLFLLCSAAEEWDEMIMCYDNIEDLSIKRVPVIVILHSIAQIKLEGFEENYFELINIVREHSDEVSIYPLTLQIALEYNSKYLIEEIYRNILKNYPQINNFILVRLSNLLLDYNYKNKCMEILEPRALRNEELFLIFIRALDIQIADRDEMIEKRRRLRRFIEEGCKFKILLQYIIQLNFELRDFKSEIFSSLREYRELFGMDDYYSRYKIAASIEIDNLVQVDDEISCLIETGLPQDLQLISRLKASQNSFEEAERIAIQALYLMRNEINEDIVKNHLSLYFSSLINKSAFVNFKTTEINTVTILKNEKNIRKIAIHADDSYWNESGEEIFGCENYGQNEHISISLMSLSRVGNKVEVDNDEYEVIEVIRLGTFIFRYCLSEIQLKYSDSNFMEVMSFGSGNEFHEKLGKHLREHKEKKKNQLALYNFSQSDFGMPISSFSGKNLAQYAEVLLGIFNLPNQSYYSGVAQNVKSQKYVLSLSSIILLAYLDYFPKLEPIVHKITVSENLESKVKSLIKELNNIKDNKTGRLNLSAENEVYKHMYGSEELMEQRRFWIKILQFLLKLEKCALENISSEVYDVLSEFVFEEDLVAIELGKNKDYCFVVDDLFLRKAAIVESEDIKTNNFVGLLIAEKLLNKEEEYLLNKKLIEKEFLFPIRFTN